MYAGSLQIRLVGALSIGIACSIIACSGGGQPAATTTSTGSSSAPVTVALTPGTADVMVSNSMALTATVSNTTNTEVMWTVDNVENGNPSVGQILGSGASVSYLAPDSAGTHVLVAASRADLSRRGSSTVRVKSVVAVALNPSTSTLTTGGTQSFTASVTGSTNTAVTWAVDGITGGSSTVGLLSGSGATVTYTAPGAAGSHVITATSAADLAKHASASVTVQAAPAPVSVSLSPAAFSLNAGGAQALTASVSGSTNTSVTWAVDGVAGGNSTVGTITGTGNVVTYTAPAVAGSHSVVATSVADGTKRGTANATIAAGCAPAATNALTVNVMDTLYGAKGNGVADDTAALQKAVNAVAGTGGTVYLPTGTYMVNALTSVLLKSGMTFSMAPGAVLKAIPNSSSNYAVVKISNASNVNMVGGTIQGERDAHTGTGGEWGHGIVLNNAQHVVISGLTARDCWGDGIDVAFSSDVTLCNLMVDNNRRQGMSITSVNGMVVRNSTFKNTHGTLPEDGIDIEPNVGETVTNVLITGCSFLNNSGFGVEIGVPLSYAGQAWINGVVVDGNTCTGNGVNTLSTSGRAGIEASDTSGHQITNNICSNNLGYGILLRNSANNFTVTGNTANQNTGDGIQQYLCSGNTITGNTVTGNGGHGIYSPNSTGGTVANNTVSGNGMVP